MRLLIASDSDIGEKQFNHTALHGSLANMSCESMDDSSLENCRQISD
jgi:hypothetical protein